MVRQARIMAEMTVEGIQPAISGLQFQCAFSIVIHAAAMEAEGEAQRGRDFSLLSGP